MRILIATAEPCPTFRPDVAVLFGKYLPRLGVVSDLIAERTGDADAAVPWGGGQAFLTLRRGKAGRHLIFGAHCFVSLLLAESARYHAIQVRDMPVVAAVALIAARLKRLPFYYWMSFPVPEGQIALAQGRGLSAGLLPFLVPWLRGRIGRFLLYRVVLARADHIFVQSERMRDDIALRGMSEAKITPVPMGVDLEVLRPERIAPCDDPRLKGKRVLIHLGSLDRDRQIDVLFEMLKRVQSDYPDVVLALVGDAADEPHRRWLRQRAGHLGVADAIIWTGWLPIQEGWKYVRAAEIGLSPIPRGPLLDSASPTKTVEYLALGVPVVGNDNPDQRLMLEEGGGGLCVPFTAGAFAHAVCRLLSNEPLRRAMACSGQNFVRARRSYEFLARELATKYANLPKT